MFVIEVRRRKKSKRATILLYIVIAFYCKKGKNSKKISQLNKLKDSHEKAITSIIVNTDFYQSWRV